MLRREDWRINIKRVRRLYREEDLALARRKPKRRRSAVARPGQALATRPNERWAMDFVHDQLATREPLRVLTVIDCYTRECVALVARMTFRGEDVAAVLSTVAQSRTLPPVIQCDQGTEFTSLALDHWAYWNEVQLAFSRPATPGDNARCEAFNGFIMKLPFDLRESGERKSPSLFASNTQLQATARRSGLGHCVWHSLFAMGYCLTTLWYHDATSVRVPGAG